MLVHEAPEQKSAKQKFVPKKPKPYNLVSASKLSKDDRFWLGHILWHVQLFLHNYMQRRLSIGDAHQMMAASICDKLSTVDISLDTGLEAYIQMYASMRLVTGYLSSHMNHTEFVVLQCMMAFLDQRMAPENFCTPTALDCFKRLASGFRPARLTHLAINYISCASLALTNIVQSYKIAIGATVPHSSSPSSSNNKKNTKNKKSSSNSFLATKIRDIQLDSRHVSMSVGAGMKVKDMVGGEFLMEAV
jgi:hypothetical protein